MEMFTRSVSLTPPTNPEITSIMLEKFPYAKLTSKAFGGSDHTFFIHPAWPSGLPTASDLDRTGSFSYLYSSSGGCQPNISCIYCVQKTKTKTSRNNCLWGVSSSFWRSQPKNNKCTAAQRFVYLFSSWLEENLIALPPSTTWAAWKMGMARKIVVLRAKMCPWKP